LLTLLCHVSPRAEQLAEQLRETAEPRTHLIIDFLPFSFERIHANDSIGISEQLLIDSAQSEASASCVWVAVSPSAASLLNDQVRLLPIAAQSACQNVAFLGIGSGTQQVLDEVVGRRGSAIQTKLNLQLQAIVHPDGTWPDALRMEQILNEVAQYSALLPRLRIVHGQGGRVDWLDRLERRGFEVKRFEAYRRVLSWPSLTAQSRLEAAWAGREAVCLVLPSAHAVQQIASLPILMPFACEKLSGSVALRDWLYAQNVLLPHPRLQALAQEMGFGKTRLYRAGTAGLLDALKSASEYH
jgi:uroporphyrinogen-III synthase